MTASASQGVTRKEGFVRCTKKSPCPICAHESWCSYFSDGLAVICMNIPSDHPTKNGGWTHRLDRPVKLTGPVVATASEPLTKKEREKLANQAEVAYRDARRTPPGIRWFDKFKTDQGFSEDMLDAFRVGVDLKKRELLTPLFDADGQITGHQRRDIHTGKKKFRGRHGLFLPAELSGTGLFVVTEGATDAMSASAMLQAAGVQADVIGVCSASSSRTAIGYLQEIVSRGHYSRAVVIADPGEAGQRSGAKAAETVVPFVPDTRIITPPAEMDMSDWRRSGATPEDLCEAVDLADPVGSGVDIPGQDGSGVDIADDEPESNESGAKTERREKAAQQAEDLLHSVAEAEDPLATLLDHDNIEILKQIRQADPASWVRVRERIKGEKWVPVGQLDGLVIGERGGERGPSSADLLVQLLEEKASFHHHDDVAYATVQTEEHAETVALRTRAFKRIAAGLFYRTYDSAPSAETLTTATAVLECMAFAGDEIPTCVRIAEVDDVVWLDLGLPDWRIVRVTRDGWTIIYASAEDPVRFWRPRGLQPLPVPESGGSLASFWELWPALDDAQRALLSGWLVGMFRPGRPAPVLVLRGEHGSGKSTLGRMLRRTIDPNSADLRSPPRDERDLAIAARNSEVVALDNMSKVAPWLSDALARLATGGGFATRELYSDGEETILSAIRPVMLNGITSVIEREDLLDRAVLVSVPRLKDENRLDEDELWARFGEIHPQLLGGILDAVVAGLQRIPTVKLERHPRMLAWAKWVVACEPGLGVENGVFLTAYTANRGVAVRDALEASPIGPPLVALLAERGGVNCTMAVLLDDINGKATDAARKQKSWPGTPRGLRGALDRLAPVLRSTGYEIEFPDSTSSHGCREVCIRFAQTA